MSRNPMVGMFCLLCCSLSFGFQEPRIGQPVTVNGSELTALLGASVTDLHLRIWDGSSWTTPAFQIDERDGNNSFFEPDDGLLDDNDVLVFQPQDGGQQASNLEWIADDLAQQNPRIEIAVTDPVENAVRYVYLYQSSTLVDPMDLAQVTYDDMNDTVSGATYQLGFDASGAILSALQFRDGLTLGPDILDREKLRISGSALILTFSLSEDDLTVNSIQLIEGPVRIMRRVNAEIEVAGNTVPFSLDRFFYRRYFEIPAAAGKVSLPALVSLNAIRVSRDFNDMANGATLRDPNNAALTVDGMPDAGVQTTITAPQQQAYWSELALNDFSLWNAMSFVGLANSTVFYYQDNSAGGTADSTPDTGDLVSFGDHGVLFNSPDPDAIQFSFGTFVDQGGNLTPTSIENYIAQPLTTAETSQDFSETFWEFVALWGTTSTNAQEVPFLVNFINLFGVPPLD